MMVALKQLLGRNKRTYRRRKSRICIVESLEPRLTLDAAAVSLIATFNNGLNSLEESSRRIAAASAADVADVPLVKDQIDTAFQADVLRRVFKVSAVKVAEPDSVDAVMAKLRAKDFVVKYFSTTTANAAGNYLEVTRAVKWQPQAIDAVIGGASGFEYLDGNLSGRLTGSVPQVTGSMHYVIDAVGFHVGATSFVSAKFSLSGSAVGEIKVGLHEAVKTSGTVKFSGTSVFRLRDDGDGKLSVQQLEGKRNVIGSLTANVSFAGGFQAPIPGVTTIAWTGQFNASVSDKRLQMTSKLVAPDYRQVVGAISGRFVAGLQHAPWFQHLEQALKKELPIINRSVADMLKFDERYSAALQAVGISVLTPNAGATAMEKFVRGERVDLVKVDQKLSRSLSNELIPEIPLADVHLIPGLVEGEATAFLTANVTFTIEVHAGLDTDGIWFSPDSRISATGEIEGGVKGKIKVLGHGLVKAKGSLAIPTTLELTPLDVDRDGRVYVSQMRASPCDSLTSYVDVDLELKLKATIDLKLTKITVFSKTFKIADIIHIDLSCSAVPRVATITVVDDLPADAIVQNFIGAGRVSLQAANGQYLSALWGGGSDLDANRDLVMGWETFEVVPMGGNRVVLKTWSGYFLCAEGGGGREVNATPSSVVSGCEVFEVIGLADGTVAFKAANGQYLAAEGGGGGKIMANRDWVLAWETFRFQKVNLAPQASDDRISVRSKEAVMVAVLNGDQDPDGGTLRVASFSNPSFGSVMRGADNPNLLEYRSHPGFLGTDQFTYTIEDGQGGSSTATVHVDVRPPANSDAIVQQFIQAGRVSLQAHNGKYLSTVWGGGSDLDANRDLVMGWETFEVVPMGGNRVALKTWNGWFLCAEGGGGREVNATRSFIAGAWEVFEVIGLETGTIALKAANGKYLAAEGGGGGKIMANRDWVLGWETFRFAQV